MTHTVAVVLIIIAAIVVFSLTSWMRSKNGPLRKYRRDYREEHSTHEDHAP